MLKIAQKWALWKTEVPGLDTGTTSAPAAPPFYQLCIHWSSLRFEFLTSIFLTFLNLSSSKEMHFTLMVKKKKSQARHSQVTLSCSATSCNPSPGRSQNSFWKAAKKKIPLSPRELSYLNVLICPAQSMDGLEIYIIPFSHRYTLYLVPSLCPPKSWPHLRFQTTSCRTIFSFSVSTSSLPFLDNHCALQSLPHLPKALHLTPDTVKPTALLVHYNLNTH